jgi:hypothetical protein
MKIDRTKIAFINYNIDWNHPFKNAEPSNLNEKELEEVEKLLLKSVDESNMLRPLKKYYRQYVVIKNANGEKEVWVNGMCELVDPSFADWKKELIDIADGGNCYFNMKINLSSKTYYNLMINMQG